MRLKIAFTSSAVCIVLGAILRAVAMDASITPYVTRGNITTGGNFVAGTYAFYVEFGWFLMGFGAVLLALCIHRWAGDGKHAA